MKKFILCLPTNKNEAKTNFDLFNFTKDTKKLLKSEHAIYWVYKKVKLNKKEFNLLKERIF